MIAGIAVRDEKVVASPAGRRGTRPLAATLLAAMEVNIVGQSLTRREHLAETMVLAAINGYIEFPESLARNGDTVPGRRVVIDDAEVWLSLVKWLHNHIDGPVMNQNDVRDMHAVVKVVFGESPAFRQIDGEIYSNGAND